MENHYESHYGKSLWKTTMEDHYGRPALITMEDHYGRPLWKTTMEDHYGRPLWKTAMEDHYGRPLWKTAMEDHYGRPLWKTTAMSRFLLNIEKRSLPWFTLSGVGLASK